MSGQKSRPDRGRKPPNNLHGCSTLSNPQYIGSYLVTKPPKGNPQPGSPSILNPKDHDTQAHPRNTASCPVANIQKRNFGKGRSQNNGAHPVENNPKVVSPKPQLEPSKVLDLKELETSASPQIFRISTLEPISSQPVISPRKQILQERPAISHRCSTGELPVRDKLANKFVMGIPKQRFGVGGRRDSTASVPPGMTAESCNDPYRKAIWERLAAGEPRAPPDSHFADRSRNYHNADKLAQKASRIHDKEPPGATKKEMAKRAAKAFNKVFELRGHMRDDWIGYDELISFLGHRKATKNTEEARDRFRRASKRSTGMRSVKGGRVKKHRRKPRKNLKPKRNMLCENLKELKRGV